MERPDSRRSRLLAYFLCCFAVPLALGPRPQALAPCPYPSEVRRQSCDDATADHRAAVELEALLVEDVGAGSEDLRARGELVADVRVHRLCSGDVATEDTGRPRIAADDAEARAEVE